ncbi:MAG: insulinase family protein [Lachnospiraceae bacterium]|nr:insulinase family protein [Lachnospiraceae bacterium]
MKRTTAAIACSAILLAAFPQGVMAGPGTENAKMNTGDDISGFTVVSVTASEAYSADVYVLEHDLSAARAVIIKNDDPNRYFMLGFDTPVTDNRGCAHVFEHSAANGSVKYPSRTLTSALSRRGLASYANAMTEDRCTIFPVASHSEEQLLKLAEYYADICFEPMIMEDEDIFRSEAWRLMMDDADGDIRIGGTIYSEMKNAYTADLSAIKKAVGLLYPDSSAAHVAGGIPNEILMLSYDDVKSFHDRYYVPGCCTAYLYGDIEDARPFLAMLDGYFTRFNSPGPVFKDKETAASPGFIKKSYAFPSYEGAGSENRTEMVYAVDLGNPTDEELMDIYAFRNICNSSSSSPVRLLKSYFPSSSFGFGIESESDFTVLTVNAHGMKKEDADLFAKLTEKIFAKMATEGLSEKEIENFRQKKAADFLLAREGANKAASLLANIALLNSNGRGELFYLQMQDGYKDMSHFTNDVIKRIAASAAEPERSAMVSVEKSAELAEENDKNMKSALESVRDSMTEEDRNRLIKETERVSQKASDDPSEYIAKLSAGDTYEFYGREYEVRDETSEGVRKIGVSTQKAGVCSSWLYIDASHIPYDLLGYLSLYADLVNGSFVPTEEHERSQLPELIGTATLDGEDVSLEVTSPGRSYKPYVTVRFLSEPEKLSDAFDLTYERLFTCSFSSAEQIREGILAIKAAVRSNIENHPENVMRYLSLADANNGAAYYENTHYIEYYDFLNGLEKEDDDIISEKLGKVRDLLNSSCGAAIGYAAAPEDEKECISCADDFLGRLAKTEHEPCTYSFAEHSYPLAVVTGGQTVSSIVTVDADAIGLSDDAGADVAMAAMRDMYLMPKTRGTFGTYTCSYIADHPAFSFYTGADPVAEETLGVFSQCGDAWKIVREHLDEQSLEDYAASQLSKDTEDEGELSGARKLISDLTAGRKADRAKERAGRLKSLTLQDLMEYDPLFDAISSGRMVTIGSGAVINKNSACFAEIISPFAN